MKQPQNKLFISGRVQGAAQFLQGRAAMLSALDQAKARESGKRVKVGHGKVAEAAFRAWLTSFLPKRYGVTSGYVLSQGLQDDVPLPHYDVIIYDALESPILWEEANPDSSKEGLARAIPCEYIRAVIEIKSKFSSRCVRDAIAHLKELEIFLSQVDADDEKNKLYLPVDFFSIIVFFELESEDARSISPLNELARPFVSRGFEGGVLLRGNTHAFPYTGRIDVGIWNEGFIETLGKIEWPTRTLLNGGYSLSDQIKEKPPNWRAYLGWGESFFAQTAFDILAMLNGTYKRGFISSWHAVGSVSSPIRVKEKQ